MKVVLLAVTLLCSLSLPAQTFRWDNEQPQRQDDRSAIPNTETGTAMLYPDYYEGSPTALGEVFDQNELTGAHKKLPLGTIVQLTRLDNGLSVQIRINDRGAYCDGCIVDITKAAAQALGMVGEREAKVRLSVLGERKGASEVNNNALATAERTPDAYESTDRFAAKGGEPAFQSSRTAMPPSPNAYEHVQARSTTTAVQEEPPLQNATEEAKGVDCVITSDYLMGPKSVQNENGISVIEVPFSPFSVQFGAYSKRSNAERHIRKLADAGFDNVFMLLEERVGEGPLHRVITAPFMTLAEAKSYVNDVRDIHDMRALVFQTRMIEVRD